VRSLTLCELTSNDLGQPPIGCYRLMVRAEQSVAFLLLACQPPPGGSACAVAWRSRPHPVVLGRLNGRDGRVKPVPPIRRGLDTGPCDPGDDPWATGPVTGRRRIGARSGLDVGSPTFDHRRGRDRDTPPHAPTGADTGGTHSQPGYLRELSTGSAMATDTPIDLGRPVEPDPGTSGVPTHVGTHGDH